MVFDETKRKETIFDPRKKWSLRGFSCSLFAYFMQCMEYSTLWLSKFFLPLWVSHLEVKKLVSYSCGLFHAYWVISSCGLCFGKCFLTGFDHSCCLPLNDFLLPLFKPSAFLLRLNNFSSLGFLRNAWTRNSYMCVVFFGPWTMISWFVLTLELSARLQNTRQSICSDRKTLENQSANFLSKFWPWRNSLKADFFVQKKALKFELCCYIVYCRRSLPTPFCEFWHVTEPNRHARVRIRPIVRRIRNLWENPPIKNAHICSCDSAGH